MEQVKNQPSPEASLHFLDYWRIIRIRKTVIISVFLLIAITATVVTFILPESYSSTARIEINPDSGVIQGMTSLPSSSYLPYNVYFIQTEFEIMQSEKVLGRVIENIRYEQCMGQETEWRRAAQDGRNDATAQAAHELEPGTQHQAD